MKRLNNVERTKLNDLILEGKSLNRISKEMLLSKSTIYYYFRRIKGRTINPIIIYTKNEALIGEFIGLFAGDGYTYKSSNYDHRVYLCFNIADKAYVNKLILNVLEKLFNKKPMIFIQENRLNICYDSKPITEFIGQYLTWNKNFRKVYSVKLIERAYSNKFMIGFIRGCLDSDGYFTKKKISFATVSPGLKDNIVKFLKCLRISHSVNLYKEKRTNRKSIYHIYIYKPFHSKFIKIIKPRNIKD